MFVPSRLISATSPACEEEDKPRTPTIAAVPIAIPSADSAARSGRRAARHSPLEARLQPQPSVVDVHLVFPFAVSETTWPFQHPDLARRLICEARVVRDH